MNRFSPACMYAYVPHACSTHIGQKRAPELSFQMVVSCHGVLEFNCWYSTKGAGAPPKSWEPLCLSRGKYLNLVQRKLSSNLSSKSSHVIPSSKVLFSLSFVLANKIVFFYLFMCPSGLF